MGDGATRQGALHETFNLAMLWNLPVVFIVENNGYAMGTSVERTANHSEIWKLGLGYEMPCQAVDGMDPAITYAAIQEAVDRARNGGGPTFLEIRTYRYKGHSMSDAQLYRTKGEVSEYQKVDPILTSKEMLLKKKWATKEDLEVIDQRVKALVAECVEFASNSPFPEGHELFKHVYTQEDYPFVTE
jgi:pyruvate dehydrogenase E1 component alpha subunit